MFNYSELLVITIKKNRHVWHRNRLLHRRWIMPQCHYEGFYIHSNELFRRVRKMGERTDSEQNSNILRLLCNMNERMARKRLFSGAASRRIPDEDPPWALKFPSDVRMMDRDTRTSESVVCSYLTLRMRFISRSTRRVIAAISGISDVKVRGKITFSKKI